MYICLSPSMAKSLVHPCPLHLPRLWDLSKGFPTNDLTVEVLPARPWPKSTKRPRRQGKFSSIASVVKGCPTRCNTWSKPIYKVFKMRNKQKWTRPTVSHCFFFAIQISVFQWNTESLPFRLKLRIIEQLQYFCGHVMCVSNNCCLALLQNPAQKVSLLTNCTSSKNLNILNWNWVVRVEVLHRNHFEKLV